MTKEQVRRALGYIRVSTAEQADSGLGLEAQREQIATYCEYRQIELVGIYEDHVGGRSTNGRHELQRALAALKAHEADALVVAKLDRLGRSSLDIAHINETSRRQNWAIIALDLDLDTSTPMGEAMMSMAAVFAQLERRMIGQRTKDALAIKKGQGVTLGRRSWKSPDPHAVSKETERRILRLRKRGLSYRKIADQVGLHFQTVYRVVVRSG